MGGHNANWCLDWNAGCWYYYFATILESVGIPASAIALIMGVDRILDMCRTSVNGAGDMAASIVLNKLIPEAES